ncbi:MAG: hypothetical protein PPFGHCPK_01384 (plasmid) [Spiroplasma endosymbiont of Drosophila atripex]|nr:MAG: hypothetical protein PPFGHCPK_01384 [Spiroplasma endosymbiont of Drosophila atripex]
MINDLKPSNDKINMIPIIKLINKRIKFFFDNLKLNKKINLNDEENINNILNINGSWGSGKSTIVNNLEKNWKFKNEKPIFIIINLWEYEIIDYPYYEIIEDIIRNIKPLMKNNNENDKNSKIKKFLSRIKNLKFSIPITEPHTGMIFSPTIESEFDNLDKENQDLKTTIKNATDEIEELINFTNKNIIIIFDELDRCLPNNQIKFLSYIKNIFLKLKNVFYVITSNNEVINANINNISIEKNNIFNEKYTDKIFNVSISLKDIFFVENMNFSTNDYIQEFMKQENIINPRIIKRLLIQVNKTMDYLKQNEIFYFLRDKRKTRLKEIVSKRLEFIIFYIKYIKFNGNQNYNYVLRYINTNSIEWEFLCKKIRLITNYYDKKVLLSKSNQDIFQWILKNKELYFESPTWERNPQVLQESLYFYIEINNTILPIWFSCFIPFLGYYINNISDFDLEKVFKLIKYPFKDEKIINTLHYEIKNRNFNNHNYILCSLGHIIISIKLEELNIPNDLKSFINILVKDFDIKHFVLDEFKITFDVIKIFIDNSIFDY